MKTCKKKEKQEQMKNAKPLKTTHNPRRFPGFAVGVVTLFDEILDDAHDFSECVFSQRKINNQIWEVVIFPRKVKISFGREKYTFHRRKSTNISLRSASLTKNFSFRIISHSTTTTTTTTTSSSLLCAQEEEKEGGEGDGAGEAAALSDPRSSASGPGARLRALQEEEEEEAYEKKLPKSSSSRSVRTSTAGLFLRARCLPVLVRCAVPGIVTIFCALLGFTVDTCTCFGFAGFFGNISHNFYVRDVPVSPENTGTLEFTGRSNSLVIPIHNMSHRNLPTTRRTRPGMAPSSSHRSASQSITSRRRMWEGGRGG